MPLGLPPAWAIVVAVTALLFGGGSGVVWALRRDLREGRTAPATEDAQRLENQKTAAEIAQLLRENVSTAMAEMRLLLADARAESAAAREDGKAARAEAEHATRAAAEASREAAALREENRAARAEAARFRQRVEKLLTDHGIEIPDWWHETP